MNRILLVEDDRDIVSALSEFLGSEGFTVKSVSGQREALDIISRIQFDIVLLDISLSNGNGFAVCSAIKSEKLSDTAPTQPPLIFISLRVCFVTLCVYSCAKTSGLKFPSQISTA